MIPVKQKEKERKSFLFFLAEGRYYTSYTTSFNIWRSLRASWISCCNASLIMIIKSQSAYKFISLHILLLFHIVFLRHRNTIWRHEDEPRENYQLIQTNFNYLKCNTKWITMATGDAEDIEVITHANQEMYKWLC